MANISILLMALYVSCLIASVVGLLSQRKSKLYLFAGVPVLILSSLGFLHCFEGPSFIAMAIYGSLAAIGLGASLRNLFPIHTQK
jgi:hypothetical protein